MRRALALGGLDVVRRRGASAPRYPALPGLLEYVDGRDLAATGLVSSWVGRVAGTVFGMAISAGQPTASDAYFGGSRSIVVTPGAPGTGLYAPTKLGLTTQVGVYVEAHALAIENSDSANMLACVGDVFLTQTVKMGVRQLLAHGDRLGSTLTTVGYVYSTSTILTTGAQHRMVYGFHDAGTNVIHLDGVAQTVTGGALNMPTTGAILSIGGGAYAVAGRCYGGMSAAIRRVAFCSTVPTPASVAAWEAWCAS